MNRFSRISTRRKVLFGLLLAIFALIGVLSWLGVAGFRGTEARDMDWDSDGQVTRSEMLQGYTVIAVREDVEGNRVCRRYVRMRDREQPIRVDCRTETAAAKPAAE